MADAFRCSLVTPERPVLDADATYADLPAHDGQLGVMHNRAAMMIKLGVGPLRLELPEGGTRRFVLDGGFAQMKDNRLTLISEKAVAAEDIRRDEAQAALTRAQSLPMSSAAEVDRRRHDVAFAEQLVKLASE